VGNTCNFLVFSDYAMILLKDKEQHENKDCDFREKLCTGRCGLMIPVCMFDSHDCCEELQHYLHTHCHESHKTSIDDLSYFVPLAELV
jgi:hypothetical protein